MSDFDDYARDINQFFQASFAALAPQSKRPIMCAVCEKPVDKVEVTQNIISNSYSYAVWCHGETDHVSFTPAELADMTKAPEPGYAFTDEARRIEDERTRTISIPDLADKSES